jgi:hypothetical protein
MRQSAVRHADRRRAARRRIAALRDAPRSLLPVSLACDAVAGFARAVVFGNTPLFSLDTAPASLQRCCRARSRACWQEGWPRSLSVALYKIEDLFAKLPFHWACGPRWVDWQSVSAD